jgi:hypothetical protein
MMAKALDDDSHKAYKPASVKYLSNDRDVKIRWQITSLPKSGSSATPTAPESMALV